MVLRSTACMTLHSYVSLMHVHVVTASWLMCEPSYSHQKDGDRCIVSQLSSFQWCTCNKSPSSVAAYIFQYLFAQQRHTRCSYAFTFSPFKQPHDLDLLGYKHKALSISNSNKIMPCCRTHDICFDCSCHNIRSKFGTNWTENDNHAIQCLPYCTRRVLVLLVQTVLWT